ncbi:MAG: AAA-type ATPase lid domain-containing protein, partial [Polyangia bacterium]
REDIVPLARRFVAFFGAKKSRTADGTPRPTLELTPEAETALARYDWPGNVRELRNAIERAVIIAGGVRIGPEALPQRIAGAKREIPSVGGNFTLDEIEHEHIARILDRTATLEEGARILGIDTSTLWRKRKKLDEA